MKNKKTKVKSKSKTKALNKAFVGRQLPMISDEEILRWDKEIWKEAVEKVR